jgi:hypothetical protein
MNETFKFSTTDAIAFLPLPPKGSFLQQSEMTDTVEMEDQSD